MHENMALTEDHPQSRTDEHELPKNEVHPLEENLPPQRRFLQYARKTEPSDKIRDDAERKAQEIGLSPEQPANRQQTIDITKLFLEDQKREFRDLGLGDAREALLKTTPLTAEEEQEVTAIARDRDASPFRQRIDLWERRRDPALESKVAALQALSEVERLEAIEMANVHRRTVVEIDSGHVAGMEKAEKILIGCDDPALLILSKLRSVGIPASHIQCASKEWIDQVADLSEEDRAKELGHSFHGHVLVKIYSADEEPVWVDPMGGAIKTNEHWERFSTGQNAWEDAKTGLGPYYLIKEGIDSTNSGPFTDKGREQLETIVAESGAYVQHNNEVFVSPEY
ncbi:hypothetical protein KJ596_01310 [Patescibacteria group bacterium]|nr:hypothetical protein [Patescibacteria group bacterium]MBU1868500.1 hypothetical protein [Patescibacteria group bacterium]